MSAGDWVRAIADAERRIRPHVQKTPVEPSPVLGAEGSCRVHLKLENLQRTGSFKLRGALNKVLSLAAAERARGVVAASSGNHGAGVACAAAVAGCRATVLVPETAPAHKVAAIEDLGAEVRRHGRDCVETEAHARELAERRGMAYVSPYNDAAVIAGQGTIAVELERQLDAVDAVFVALGGGGLASGIAAWLAGRGRDVEIVACSPESSPVMHASMAAGRIVEMPSRPTLSDATAGGVEPGSITLPLCRELIDRSVLVAEREIAAALRLVVERHHTLIEGAAAAAVAGFLQVARDFAGRDVAIVLCGANIGGDDLERALRLGAGAGS